jgi:hypothetical protein
VTQERLIGEKTEGRKSRETAPLSMNFIYNMILLGSVADLCDFWSDPGQTFYTVRIRIQSQVNILQTTQVMFAKISPWNKRTVLHLWTAMLAYMNSKVFNAH